MIKTIERCTHQEVLPSNIHATPPRSGRYNLYPFHSLGADMIFSGYASLADWISKHGLVKIDGYVGVDWGTLTSKLSLQFVSMGLRVNWIDTADFFKPEPEIESLVHSFLGDGQSVWGKVTSLVLDDFFQEEKLKNVEIDSDADLNIIIGIGAGLVELEGPLVYIDLPKNELLYRMRAGSIGNLGSKSIGQPESMYKRFYFVDWVVLNQHKQLRLPKASVLADAQWSDTINWMFADDLFLGLRSMSKSVFRPRPWFDPGVWGGQWMKEHFPSLSRDEENYAWSFEIIAPENGIVFESGGNLLEVSFDTLMFVEAPAVLGRHHEAFGTYFPIRFDFLDTFNGGNLSIQCHPSLSYIRENFGEQFTQDETYYMLDCLPGSVVYLGFDENIDPDEFRHDLEESVIHEKEVDIEKYVQTFRPRKHDLFLIPNRTVHSSGRNNMVLEISATPYIFTFKMYDWLQKDSTGKPRPINIDHAFNNLDFGRKGRRVAEELISRPSVLKRGDDWTLIHLPTHAGHYYDVHRMEFESKIKVETENVCHILMLVEGESIVVETADGSSKIFNYAETFIVPAAAGRYTLTNRGGGIAKVVKAFVKYGQQEQQNAPS